jgi:hypothetical protein
MSIVPLPTPLQHLGGRRFAFYPPIRNVGPNEWLYRRATWSECVVANAQSGEEIWIPRIFLGDVSRIDEPVMIVALNRELEWRHGAIVPRERKVIQFPVEVALAVNDSGAPPRMRQMAPVINIRLEPRPEFRTRKWMGVAAVLGVVALTIVTDVARQSQSHQRWDVYRGYRSFLQLGPEDDYSSTVRKLGMPAGSQTAEVDGRVVRSLNYPDRRYSIVLLGPTSSSARYIGTVNTQGRILDSVRSGDGSTYEPFLHSLSIEHSDLRTVPTL